MQSASQALEFLSRRRPNRWDLLLLPLFFGALFLLAWGGRQMAEPYALGQPLPISLDPAELPGYALRTTLRMFAALACSVLFTLVYGSLAAKSRRAEQVLIPLLDILQSVPILGFLSFTVLWFVKLFPGSLLGPETAAIFAIFTSQAWNMTFSFYYSLKMVPRDLQRVSIAFGLSPWQRFWKLEVPFAMPGLVWNTMLSVSGGWFFVVASEAITVSDQSILLPGIGSYISLAIQHEDARAIGWAVATMLIVVLLYDQLLFRPLVVWAQRFKMESSKGGDEPTSWLLDLISRSRWLPALLDGPRRIAARLVSLRLQLRRSPRAGTRRARAPRTPPRWQAFGWNLLLTLTAIATVLLLARFVLDEVSLREVGRVLVLGFYTLLRVVALTLLATALWLPIGIWVGLRPRWAQHIQPLALFLSAFPANLLFPLVVSVIVARNLDPEIWVSPLMILGTQWYILFNVIGGAAAVPNDLREAAANLGLRGRLLWKRVLLPAVFPAYLTGGLTAAGGAWNASVVAEMASWGATTVEATGLGAYIAQQTAVGDHPRVALGIAVMSLYVLLFNRLLWKRLYLFAQERLALE